MKRKTNDALNTFCNNCGRSGHLFHQCKNPIISVGFIVFRWNPIKNKREYLLIRRKNTLGYVDFIRGKYPIYDRHYLINIISEMTDEEKHSILHESFEKLWTDLWGDQISTYFSEVKVSRSKFNHLQNGVHVNANVSFAIGDLINEANQKQCWKEPEWGFPKGRRNYMENDYTCAVREFEEETGYTRDAIHTVHNIVPYEETFIGSNLRCYKHKYYLAYMCFHESSRPTNYQKSEVSQMEWLTFDKAIQQIRDYNKEKKCLLRNVDITLNNFVVII